MNPATSIKLAVAAEYRVSVAEMEGESKTQMATHPRWVAMWVMRSALGYSSARIGRQFGGRDHSSVIHALRKIGGMRKSDLALTRSMDALLEAVKAHLPVVDLGDAEPAAAMRLADALVAQFTMVVRADARRNPASFIRHAAEWVGAAGERP